MQDKDDRNLPDIEVICEYIRESLENVNIPVSDKCWENISMRLAQERKRRQVRWSLAGAAAVLLLMITVTIIDSRPQKEVSPVVFANLCDKNTTHVSVGINATSNQEKNTLAIRSDLTAIPSVIKDTTDSEETIDYSEIPYTNSEISSYNPEKASDTANSKKTLYAESHKTKENTGDDNSFDEEPGPKTSPSKNKKWTISTLTGSTNEKSGRSINGLMSDSDGYPESDGTPGSAGSQKDIDKNKYSGILSFGLKISKQLSEKISLETGLVYSSLTTTFKTPENQSLNTLRLHYLGIPLNVKVSVMEISPRIELYASAGVMAEKGLQAKLTKTDESHADGNVSTISRIKGLQYSVSASAGISCHIHKGLCLYVEPHISHYFDNDQPLSIRTAHRTIPTVNTGLRFEF